MDSSEVIGLIPQDALTEASKHYLKITNFSNKQILENILQEKLAKQSLEEFLDQVASKSPIPGGGSVCALVGALAAALSSMVCSLTLSSKKYELSHHKINQLLQESEKLRTRLYQLIDEDAQAYQKVVDTYKSKDPEKIQESLKKAATTPLEIAQTAAKILESLKILNEEGNQNAASDCGVAKLLIEAAIKGAILNIQTNLQYIDDQVFKNEAAKNIQTLENFI